MFNVHNLSNCWEKCQTDKNCKAASYDESDCYLFTKVIFRKMSLFDLEMTIEEKRVTTNLDLIKQKRYENKKLSDPFLSLVESIERSCLIKCSEIKSCIAISYKNGECLLFKKGIINHLIPHDGWITILIDGLQFPVYFNRSQIHGFYLAYNVTSEKSCWSKCLERTECIAISYGNKEGRCHLTKKGEYQIGRYNNWTTIYKENASPPDLLRNSTYSLLK